MIFPNIATMKKWVNNFMPGAPNTTQDFLQLVRASDGTVLGWIDETGTLRGSLAVGGSSSSAGVRVLQGSGLTDYYNTSSTSFVDVDDTYLKTTITAPVGYTLLVTASGTASSTAMGFGFIGINIDGNIWNQEFNTPNAIPSPFSLSASLAGDGASHVVKIQFASGSGTQVLVGNNDASYGFQVPVLTLTLAPSI